MSDVKTDNEVAVLNEQLVKEYLLANPQFFSRNPDILQTIRLPHHERGTVSLVERQQELQRNKVQVLEEEITQLMAIARQNEQIFLAFSELYLQVINCTDAHSMYISMCEIISNQLSLPKIYLKRFADDASAFHIPRRDLNNIIEHRLNKSPFYFGRLTLAEQHQLFGNESDIKSAALMLLGEEQGVGFVAFGSTDENHFFPGMDILFLKELRKILALMLEKF